MFLIPVISRLISCEVKCKMSSVICLGNLRRFTALTDGFRGQRECLFVYADDTALFISSSDIVND